MKVALIHTTINSMDPIIKAFNKIDSKIEIMNFLDEGLMHDIKNTKEITGSMLDRILDMVVKAEKSGAEGVLLACSAFSPYVTKITQSIEIPILSADIAMLERVVEKGGKIGVLTTLEAAKKTTLGLIKEISEEKNIDLDVHGEVVEKAFDEMKKGNEAIHNKLILEKVNEFLKKYDSVVLAQMSMTRSVESVMKNKNIFTSPEISAKSIIEDILKAREED